MDQKNSENNNKTTGKKDFISEDKSKLNSFYTFKVDEEKLIEIRKRSGKQIGRFMFTGVLFGFFTEWLLGNGKIYDNIIKKSTLRRLSMSLDYYRCQKKGRYDV